MILRSRILYYYKKKKEVLESQMSTSQEDADSSAFIEHNPCNMERAPKTWAPDKMYESEEFMSVLSDCTRNLSEMQNAVFTMKYLDGEDSDTICKALDITSSNYWVLVHRAKLQLRRCLEINWMS